MSVKNEAVATRVADASSLSGFEDTPFQIVHSCEGHLRVRISRLAYDAAYASYLKSLAESLDCVTKVRLNPAASSLVVEYDSNKVVTPDTVQKQVLTAIEQAARRDILQLEQNLPPTTAENSNLGWHRRIAGGAPGATLSSPNFNQEAPRSGALNNTDLSGTELPRSSATDLAEEDASRAELKSSHTLKERTPQEYALLLRGNYSVSTRLDLIEQSSSKSA
ncbi:MAG: hypothetical protein JOZ78_22305 [Chroococcidiopsidaceae cyanobacterium CP_BM_ER_R8_30]|nr:hypothetical protein [Chroococcidiopsidaceae cyanobacterium CP_BM_ER_R8_30]